VGGDPPPERAGDWAGQPHREATRLHCKKGLCKIFPARESLVSDIPAGDGKTDNFFYSVEVSKIFGRRACAVHTTLADKTSLSKWID
jgi:hypothetical protein